MTDRELMQQALEALEARGVSMFTDDTVVEDAITALRERLAQPEQKPVAWRWKERINNDFDNWVISASEPPPYAIEQQPLYTFPPKREWVGLTADEIWKCNKAKSGSAVEFHICYEHQNLEDFAEAVEAKLQEKNT